MSQSAFSQSTLSVPVSVASGGTGATTLTGVLIGTGTSAVTVKTNPSGAFVGTTDAQAISSKTITLSAGSTSIAPLILTSGTNLTTAVAGAVEFDGSIFYATAVASSRQVVSTEQFIFLSSAYTLTSTTSAQKLFNSSTNGALTVSSTTSYQFECIFSLTNMSASNGSFGFAFGGTATFTSQSWISNAVKSATLTTSSASTEMWNTTANTAISGTNTSVTGSAIVKGTVRINAGGTLVPQVSLSVANAAIVGTDAYFRIWPIGSNTIQSVGNWS